MERLDQNLQETEPKYTLSWLGINSTIILVGAFMLALIATGIGSLGYWRMNDKLLSSADFDLLNKATVYCFGVVSVTLISLKLIEVAFRKEFNYLQEGLIAAALTLFYLLLLSISEKMVFWGAYLIVSVMTVALIGWFVNGITQSGKIARLTVGILAGEYALIFLLINLGTVALLVGSLSLFGLIALTMYFTLKLKVINGELTLK